MIDTDINYDNVRMVVREKLFDKKIDKILKINIEKYDPEKTHESIEKLMEWTLSYESLKDMNNSTKKALNFILCHSIHSYGNKKRKLGGYYQNHPLGVAILYGLAERTITNKEDLPGIIASWDHDLAEEYVSSLIEEEVTIKLKKSSSEEKENIRKVEIEEFYSEEKETIDVYLKNLDMNRRRILKHRIDVPEENIDSLLIPAINSTKSLTRLGAQT